MKNFKLTVCPDYQELSKKAAEFVWRSMRRKLGKKFVLGVATGKTQIGFRQEFLKLVKLKKPCLKNLFLINLDEYWPIKKSNPCSYFQEMKKKFWEPLEKLKLGFQQKRAFIPNGEAKNPNQEAIKYEKVLKKLGGIDLQILGIGVEGHIGFNEKGSLPSSKTRLVIF